ncbi:MAG: efflux RND transporter periplasmic adaptor subunit [Anaerolineae bacterium]|nr:efflux RND transporter periplasmic adaptor subunit [Anaerolineae bacterium]
MMKQSALLFFCLCLSLTLATTACNPVAKPAVAAAPPAETGVAVEVIPVKTGSIALVFDYAGTLQAQSDVTLAPRVSGQIEAVLVAAGDPVKAGQPIAILDRDVPAAQLKQAEAALLLARLKLDKMNEGARPEEVEAAQSAYQISQSALQDVQQIDDNERTTAAAALANAQAALKLAQSEYDKIAWAGQVGETPQALTLEKATNAYEQALSTYQLQTNPSEAQLAPLQAQLAKAKLDLALAKQPFRPVDFAMAKATIQQAEAAVELAQLQLDYTTLRAPFDGIVGEVYIHQGSMVDTKSAVALFISNQVEVAVNVEESRLGQVAKGQHASLRVSAYPGVEFPGLVTSVAPLADQKTHTFVVKVTPADPKNMLRSGMYADVSLLVDEKANTLLVPRSAVIRVDSQPVVYRVNAGQVEQVKVTIGLSNDTDIEITSGLKAGDSIVVAGQSSLQDGAKVKIVPGL